MSADERRFWRTDTCSVWVGYDDDGALVFTGEDSGHLDGYEYEVTVGADQFDELRRALGADPAADVVDLVCRHAEEIMARGERTWLHDRGIERGFRSY
ncbi:hypothetical protein SAMN04489835_0864 [Mycolicibacterium rutilum]|uniref:Uncharacterized protein n=1 Tax=Mycolicibacterium rutilum TaxID=370526 RepID=A0A1H6IZ16_MYCRU|nr:hypothetical protein [Mycolicibacterium rutilum]SEH51824.1 hypothetical protein SAMN04489835_0864 [Mycolicibacterium rutilum]